MNFEAIIKKSLIDSDNIEQNYYAETLSQGNSPKYVVGKNDQSAELIAKFLINGVIDDFNQQENSWNGIPLVKTNEMPSESIIINCASSISPVQVNNNLKIAGFNNVINVSEIIGEDRAVLSLPWFVKQQREEIESQLCWWSALYDRLADEHSKKVLIDVVRFRLTANPLYMANYSVCLQDQYMEDFMEYEHEIFVDAGGYDGDTTEEFIKRYPDYRKVYLFEPSEKNFEAAKRRLHGKRDIDFKPVGVSDTAGTLCFNADAGSASAVSAESEETISVVTLDKEWRIQGRSATRFRDS